MPYLPCLEWFGIDGGGRRTTRPRRGQTVLDHPLVVAGQLGQRTAIRHEAQTARYGGVIVDRFTIRSLLRKVKRGTTSTATHSARRERISLRHLCSWLLLAGSGIRRGKKIPQRPHHPNVFFQQMDGAPVQFLTVLKTDPCVKALLCPHFQPSLPAFIAAATRSTSPASDSARFPRPGTSPIHRATSVWRAPTPGLRGGCADQAPGAHRR